MYPPGLASYVLLQVCTPTPSFYSAFLLGFLLVHSKCVWGANILSDALGTKPLTERLTQVDVIMKPGLSLLLLSMDSLLSAWPWESCDTLLESISIPDF